MCCVGAMCSAGNGSSCICRDLKIKISCLDTYADIGHFPMCPPMLEYIESSVGVFLRIQTC